jgi:hypothetical protein
MGLTLTAVKGGESVSGTMRVTTWDVAFDSNYDARGEALTPRQMGLRTVNDVQISAPVTGGFSFHYDRTNSKLRALRPAGPVLTTEATGTFAAGVAYTLAQLPGYILSIRGTAGALGPKVLIPTGETLAAGQVSVDWTTGMLTWGDAAITAATILYIAKGRPGFTADVLVVDEAAPIVANVITLVNQAIAVQYVWNDEDNELLIPVTDNVALTGAQCNMNLNSTGSSVITVTTGRIADGSVGKTKVTYLKRAGNPLQALDKQDITVTTNVAGPGTIAAQLGIPSLAIPGYGVHLAVSDTTGPAQRLVTLQDLNGVSAALSGLWNPAQNTFSYNATDSVDIMEMPFALQGPSSGGASGEELPGGTDLSWLVGVRLVARGY